MEDRFLNAAKACLKNGEQLVTSADFLSFDGSPYFLALNIIAEEEFAKGFLLFLVGSGVIPWSKSVLSATTNHQCKQLLCMLMEYSDPEIEDIVASTKRAEETLRLYEEVRQRYKEMEALYPLTDHSVLPGTEEFTARLEHRRKLKEEIAPLERLLRERDREEAEEKLFPSDIADAINVFCHKKISRRIEYYGDMAEAIAKTRDRAKQDALYVRLDKTGQVVSAPAPMTEKAVKEVMERTRKLGSTLSSALEYGRLASYEFENLAEAITRIVAGPEVLVARARGKSNLNSE